MNPAVEALLLNFAKNELVKNPQIAGGFLQHLLEKTKLDPSLQQDLVSVLEQVLPILLQNIKL